MEDLLQVGVITSTHGVRGEVKVFPTTDEPEQFARHKEVILEQKGKLKTHKVRSCAFHKNMVLLSLSEIDDMDAAEKLRNVRILIPESEATPPGEDEYFRRDLYGMTVISDEGEELGILDDIIETGANDVFIVKKEGKKDLLIPALKQCVLKVDIPGKKMEVHLLRGLRDEV